MKVFAAVIGGLLGFIVLWDAFEAVILPRRVSRKVRLTRLYYLYTWEFLSRIVRHMRPGKRRERYLGYYGPLSLIFLLFVWGAGLVIGFAMIHWAIGSELNATNGIASFRKDLYFSGTTFFTLGLGDVVPVTPWARALTVMEAGTGFGFLAIVIGYLPVIYTGFSRREVNISLMDARAGSPPSAAELLLRHGRNKSVSELNVLLHEWERWSAELLESHLSYPLLTYFRSQHENQSWLAALTTILDVCTLVVVGVDGVPVWQAQLTFAMARHALVDLAQVFNTPPAPPDPERLPPAELARVRAILASVGWKLREGAEAEAKLKELRRMYEPYVNSMAGHLFMSLPAWVHPQGAMDNWQTSAWERNPLVFASTPAEVRDNADINPKAVEKAAAYRFDW